MMLATYETFEAADECRPEGWSVSGTYKKDGTPVYFLSAPEWDEDVVRKNAFEARHGRQPSQYEEYMYQLALKMRESKVPA